MDERPRTLCGRSDSHGLHLLVAGLILLLTGCGKSADQPLANFSQDIKSSQNALTVKADGVATFPVTVKNTGTEIWPASTDGQYAVTWSYVWEQDGHYVPIEGRRTALLEDLPSGRSQTLNASIMAPPVPGMYTLRLTMVQERIAWFYGKGGKTFDLPVVVN